MKFFVTLWQILKNNASWWRVEEINILALCISFKNSGIGLFIHQNVNNSGIIVRIFGFNSHSFDSLDYAPYLKLALNFGLYLVHAFTIDDKDRGQLFFVSTEPILQPQKVNVLEQSDADVLLFFDNFAVREVISKLRIRSSSKP